MLVDSGSSQVLHGAVLHAEAPQDAWPEPDRLIASRGHAAAIVYTALAKMEFIEVAELKTYSADDSRLAAM